MRIYNPQSETRETDEWNLDYGAKDMLRATLMQVKQKGIRVIIVQSPHWYWEDTRDSPLDTLHAAVREIAESVKVPVIDINPQAYEQFKDHTVYADASHLNYEGAEIFSSILSKRLLADQLIETK
jgi:hypothetical protein